MRVVVQAEPFDYAAEVDRFASGRCDMGALVCFAGVVRDTDNTLSMMEIEHYPGMTEKALIKIAQEAKDRWSLGDVLVIHRFGKLTPGEKIMMVATAAPHRAAAFAAADFLMDYLKSRAPFWKKELSAGRADWVDAKQSDEAALSRWS